MSQNDVNVDLVSSRSVNVLDLSSNTSIAQKTIDLSDSSISFVVFEQIRENLQNQKKRKFENKHDNSKEMMRS
jgi:hypothetical protein